MWNRKVGFATSAQNSLLIYTHCIARLSSVYEHKIRSPTAQPRACSNIHFLPPHEAKIAITGSFCVHLARGSTLKEK
jgi:hypothetical protein